VPKRLDHLLEDFLQFARPRELIARPVLLAEPLDAVLGLLSGDAHDDASRASVVPRDASKRHAARQCGQ
jgi:hypothetical protein